MSFLWSIHSSPATKSSSTRPQKVLKLVPRAPIPAQELDIPEETINQVLRDLRGKGVAQEEDIHSTTPIEPPFEEYHHVSPPHVETRPRSQGETSKNLDDVVQLIMKQQEMMTVLQMQIYQIDGTSNSQVLPAQPDQQKQLQPEAVGGGEEEECEGCRGVDAEGALVWVAAGVTLEGGITGGELALEEGEGRTSVVRTSESGIGPTWSTFTQTEATSSDDGVYLARRPAFRPRACLFYEYESLFM
ncbi:hypothetical protein Taro_005700 [Colocasia esculenta]|uniref:Uncharacterized protein n=1 Tax=Colocasia esculenta TaxID=4460 RepID=A0A843TVD3_COLES|nr:hypothetical protein [Colocasia esculenta]